MLRILGHDNSSNSTALNFVRPVTLPCPPRLNPVQFNMAKLIPGKEEFFETLRYFSRRIDIVGVDLRLNTKIDATSLQAADPAFDAVVLATGVLPRKLSLEGADHPKV